MTEASTPATTENPLKKAYWLGRVDPRPLALFRLLFCSVVLFDLLARLGEVRAFLSDEGWAPAETIPRFSDSWSLFRLVGSPPAVMALYLAGVATVVAVLVGYRTRLAQVAMYVFLASAHFRNGRFFGTGLDHVTGTLSFWLLFADTGAVWSMDWLRKRRDGSAVPALGLRLLQWQVALIFFFASLSKWATWRDGLAIYHVLQIKGFTTPLGPALVAWPWLCIALNWLVLCLELAVPLLLIPLAPLAPRWMRAAGILGGTALFIGIQAVLEVGCFAELMIAGLSLFVLPEWLDRLGWAGRSKATEAAPVTGEAAVPGSNRPFRRRDHPARSRDLVAGRAPRPCAHGRPDRGGVAPDQDAAALGNVHRSAEPVQQLVDRRRNPRRRYPPGGPRRRRAGNRRRAVAWGALGGAPIRDDVAQCRTDPQAGGGFRLPGV